MTARAALCSEVADTFLKPDPGQSAWLQEVASRGEVKGSLEGATTGRSDKKLDMPNGQWLFMSHMDQHRWRGAEPGDGNVRSAVALRIPLRWARRQSRTCHKDTTSKGLPR